MSSEHPFAQYVRIIGKGRKAARSLTFDESFAAMQMILNDEVEDIQLGAFLMLLRVKEETAEELAGFASATKIYIENQTDVNTSTVIADIDWPSYAGKNKQLHWYILSILLLTENDISTLCHGSAGHTAKRVYTENIFSELGLPIASDLANAGTLIKKQNFCYLPLNNYCQPLERIINLRNLFGLRSPVHSFSKLINPANCQHLMISTFHPSFKPVHQQAAALLAYDQVAIFKGESGEAESRPHAIVSVENIRPGITGTEQWPALISEKPDNETTIDAPSLAKAWKQGASTYGEAAVIGTCAIALKLCNKSNSQKEAIALATEMWHNRNLSLL